MTHDICPNWHFLSWNWDFLPFAQLYNLDFFSSFNYNGISSYKYALRDISFKSIINYYTIPLYIAYKTRFLFAIVVYYTKATIYNIKYYVNSIMYNIKGSYS